METGVPGPDQPLPGYGDGMTGPMSGAAGTDLPTNPQRRVRAKTTELGMTGTSVFGGQILNDPNSELLFPRNVQTYDRMRRSDGQVKSALLAIMLPILSLPWSVEPYAIKDPDTGKKGQPLPADIEIARSIEEDLFAVDDTWQTTLRNILGMLWAGFSWAEKVFEIRDDGLAHLKKLAPRLQTTVFRWNMERDGSLTSITQRAVNPAVGVTEQVDIKWDHMLVFVHDKEGADWTGNSVLRSAYKHFYYKDWLYRIGVINTERAGGVPVITLPPEASDADIQAAHDVGETFHLHERAYVLEPGGAGPEGWKFRLETGQAGRVADVMAQVAHHDNKISANILAQFLDFGSADSTGMVGRGATSEFVELFLMAEEAVIRNIEETINRYLIKPWVDLNWRVEGYPELRAQNIRGFNVRRMGVVLKALTDGRLIVPDDKLETFLREALGLPEADPTTRRDQMAGGQFEIGPDGQPILGPDGQPIPKQPGGPGGPGGLFGQPDNGPAANGEPFNPADSGNFPEDAQDKRFDDKELRDPFNMKQSLWVRRNLTDLERSVNLHEIDYKTRATAVQMLDRIRPIMKDQAKRLAEQATRDADVRELKVPYVGKLSSTAKAYLHEVFEYGRRQVRAELFRQAEFRRARTQASDQKIFDRLRLDEQGNGALILSEPDHGMHAEQAGRYVDFDMKLAGDDPNATKGAAMDFIGMKADLLAERWANRLKDTVVTTKLRALRASLDEDATAGLIDRQLDEMSDRATRAIILNSIADAFALGRNVEGTKQSRFVRRMQYSALMDHNTCNVCEELDGQVGDVDDARLATPNLNCLGEVHGNSCRCIAIFELA